MEDAAKYYFAQSFRTDFSLPQSGKDIASWISGNTGGLLDNPNAFLPNPYQIMSILNTVHFYDTWMKQFEEKNTKDAAFHLADENTVTCSFMNASNTNPYYKGKNYAATSLGFSNGNKMVFVLPDEKVTVSSILNDTKILEEAVSAVTDDEKIEMKEVAVSLPKFKFGSELQLKEILQSLGIQNAFSPKADFSVLADPAGAVYVSSVSQGAAISIDEKGCEAVAYTNVSFNEMIQTTELITVNLNRPFLFAILSSDNTLLFTGTINNPTV